MIASTTVLPHELKGEVVLCPIVSSTVKWRVSIVPLTVADSRLTCLQELTITSEAECLTWVLDTSYYPK
ncbi:MAG: hypothetical protein ACJAZA_000926 [Shewanella psychromarinicola]|jgi:hypothetical protein